MIDSYRRGPYNDASIKVKGIEYPARLIEVPA